MPDLKDLKDSPLRRFVQRAMPLPQAQEAAISAPPEELSFDTAKPVDTVSFTGDPEADALAQMRVSERLKLRMTVQSVVDKMRKSVSGMPEWALLPTSPPVPVYLEMTQAEMAAMAKVLELLAE